MLRVLLTRIYVDKSKTKFSPKERITTPYGVGVVVEHRKRSQIVVIDLSGPWSARAYLKEGIVKRDGAGFIGSILRQFSTSQSPKQITHSSKRVIENNHFPYAMGTPIFSPFGEGKVVRPLTLGNEKQALLFTSPPKTTAETNYQPANTIAISLALWTLRDGRHPILYCTVETAERWRTKKASSVCAPTHNRENSYIYSIFGSLVSGTVEAVSGTVESLKKITVPRVIETPISKIEPRKYERYYKDGAAVTTAYGDGTVQSFRESDGFYDVSLIMKSGNGTAFGNAYLQEDSMSYCLAQGCVEGYPVTTTFSSGVLQSVNPTTGVHNVIIQSFGAICYLQPGLVLRPMKASVGEDVSTPYGKGKVFKY